MPRIFTVTFCWWFIVILREVVFRRWAFKSLTRSWRFPFAMIIVTVTKDCAFRGKCQTCRWSLRRAWTFITVRAWGSRFSGFSCVKTRTWISFLPTTFSLCSVLAGSVTVHNECGSRLQKPTPLHGETAITTHCRFTFCILILVLFVLGWCLLSW